MNTTDSPGPHEDERVRRAIALIAEEAGKHPAPPQTQTAQQGFGRWRRRLLSAAAAATVCVGVVVGVSVVGNEEEAPGRDGPSAAGGRGQSLPEAIACSRAIVRGDVVSVSSTTASHTITFTMEVQDWIKPATGQSTVRLTIADPAYVDPQDALESGQHLLVITPQISSQPAGIARKGKAAEYEARIRDALDEASRISCPAEWRAP